MNGKGRREPYTDAGVRRVLCSQASCENKAMHQWQVCADGRRYRPICTAHDIALNHLVLRFMGDPEVKAKIERYAREQLAT